MTSTKFLLDSGDPDEYITLKELAKENGSELWGSTTNPSLVAKKLAGQKISQEQALEMQKDLVMTILDIVPGAVSAEVYAEADTTAEAMIEQGREIGKWHDRIYVKLPTTIEGFKARTALRKEKIPINNTLVFSQEQIFAIALHEDIIQEQFGPIENQWPCFISPFVGRLDDIGIDGMQLVEHGMKVKALLKTPIWMLEASVRKMEHMKRGNASGAELVTAPLKTYEEWFTLETTEQKEEDDEYAKQLTSLQLYTPPEDLIGLDTIEAFMEAITTNKLNIKHELTDKGIERFTADWKAIIAV